VSVAGGEKNEGVVSLPSKTAARQRTQLQKKRIRDYRLSSSLGWLDVVSFILSVPLLLSFPSAA
jgi:hypothetical protein